MVYREALGALVKNIRLNRKMSVKELADKTGVSPTNIYKIERGEVFPRIDTLDMLFKELEYKIVIGGSKDGKSSGQRWHL